MPPTSRYPGVYIEEIPDALVPTPGRSSTLAAFIGGARRGPVNVPLKVGSAHDYELHFGSPRAEDTLGHAVQHYFRNGGHEACIVRVFNGDPAACTATLALPAGDKRLTLEAASPGSWGQKLRARVDHMTGGVADESYFNLTLEEMGAGGNPVNTEVFRDLCCDPGSPRFIDAALTRSSHLARVRHGLPAGTRPDPAMVAVLDEQGRPGAATTSGSDGAPVGDAELLGDQHAGTGLHALEGIPFKLLCLPPPQRDTEVAPASWAEAAAYCQQRRAMLLMDAPAHWSAPLLGAELRALRECIGLPAAANVALYFPRLLFADPLAGNRAAAFAPCGAIAGVIVRNDAERGVWKAPSGESAQLLGAQDGAQRLDDAQQWQLNQQGLNCLRSFHGRGWVVWGARTLAGADELGSEWKYISVRRLALFIEQGLEDALAWAAFEPNGEALWARLRREAGSFLLALMRQGAFQGGKPEEAFFVHCGRESTSPAELAEGHIVVQIGFAPIRPAEFILLRLRLPTADLSA
ncbi:phage tail sheath family protein [Azoarcus indigens]|uniref:Tail sheath protein C-terminal domain-containing protein n=1 Tax=Azoarcus indigens TaxID=29545 RepID=A0A4R6DNY6_9RHOO|nr:phage tail sheath subtilisin-like domain-containing protein [Azoarcus indigens]NMG65733.1 phage tail sheath family protein [Azoarcus indigens]TDN46089.1 hypothetical protein C7389_12718 [Azoarcus indigens]